MLLAIYIAVECLILALGVLFWCGIGTPWIAGYNTATPKEKAHIDQKKLGKYTGALMFVLAVCWLFVVASALLDSGWLFWVGLALFMLAFLAGAVYIHTGNRLCK